MQLTIYRVADTYGFSAYGGNSIDTIPVAVPDGTTVERVGGLGWHAWLPVGNARHMVSAARLCQLAENGRLGCRVVSQGRPAMADRLVQRRAV